MAAQSSETGDKFVHFLEQSWGVVEDETSPEFQGELTSLLDYLQQSIIIKQDGDFSEATTAVTFNHYDGDSDGKLNTFEFEMLIKDCAATFDRKYLNHLLKRLDKSIGVFAARKVNLKEF